jgi:hypothetical protein
LQSWENKMLIAHETWPNLWLWSRTFDLSALRCCCYGYNVYIFATWDVCWILSLYVCWTIFWWESCKSQITTSDSLNLFIQLSPLIFFLHILSHSLHFCLLIAKSLIFYF